MDPFICTRCGYQTVYRHRFKTHLSRKYICKPILSDDNIYHICQKYGITINTHTNLIEKKNITNHQIISKPNHFICEFCQYQFTKKCNLTRHSKLCKQKHLCQINNLTLENDKLKHQIINTDQQFCFNTSINNDNSTHISNNSITINNYGHENLSYLTPNEMSNYVKNLPPGVIKFIEKVHFNPKHPENKNLRITNKKDSLIQIRKKNKWIFENKTNVITNLLSQKYQLLEEHLSAMNQEDLTNQDKRVINRFRNNYEENVRYVKDMLKQIELLILNNSNS